MHLIMSKRSEAERVTTLLALTNSDRCVAFPSCQVFLRRGRLICERVLDMGFPDENGSRRSGVASGGWYL